MWWSCGGTWTGWATRSPPSPTVRAPPLLALSLSPFAASSQGRSLATFPDGTLPLSFPFLSYFTLLPLLRATRSPPSPTVRAPPPLSLSFLSAACSALRCTLSLAAPCASLHRAQGIDLLEPRPNLGQPVPRSSPAHTVPYLLPLLRLLCPLRHAALCLALRQCPQAPPPQRGAPAITAAPFHFHLPLPYLLPLLCLLCHAVLCAARRRRHPQAEELQQLLLPRSSSTCPLPYLLCLLRLLCTLRCAVRCACRRRHPQGGHPHRALRRAGAGGDRGRDPRGQRARPAVQGGAEGQLQAASLQAASRYVKQGNAANLQCKVGIT